MKNIFATIKNKKILKKKEENEMLNNIEMSRIELSKLVFDNLLGKRVTIDSGHSFIVMEKDLKDIFMTTHKTLILWDGMSEAMWITKS